jgi:hypothetical protein
MHDRHRLTSEPFTSLARLFSAPRKLAAIVPVSDAFQAECFQAGAQGLSNQADAKRASCRCLT